MSTLNDITSSVSEILTTLAALDLKLDDVKAKIDLLVVGTPVTQEQIDALAASLDAVKAQASKVLTESTELAA